MTNAVGYTRLSRSGNGHGLDAQERAIRDYCARNGWALLGIETDEAASGRSTRKRPGLARALESCSSNAAQVIVSSRVDRLARSSLDFARLIDNANRHGFNIVCVEQGFDLRTPEGKLLANILAGFAEFEADLISARTKAGLDAARRKGHHGGNPKLGRISEEATARILKLRQSKLSLGKIAQALTEEGFATANGGPWNRSAVYYVIKRNTRRE